VTDIRLQGTIRAGGPDWVYLPVEVPAGVAELAVRYRYDRPATPPGVPGNALDIGVFDERGPGGSGGPPGWSPGESGGSGGPPGWSPGGPGTAGFRGWSGGARDGFAIGRSGTTPGYLPGPVNPGTWQLVLGPYTVAPQGLHWEVEVSLRRGPPGPALVPDPAPTRAAGRGRAWYRGDLHTHTVHSDGRRTPAELAADARAAGLVFIASTEHNTSSASLGWGGHAGPDLLVIDGREVTTRDGHWLALGLRADAVLDWRYRAADGVLDRVLAELHGQGGLAVAAHPFNPCLGCVWRFGYRGLDAVEVWNGPWTPDDEAALALWDRTLAGQARAGRFLPAVGGSDAHRRQDRVGLPQNVVLADGLERGAVLQALAEGRCWLASSASVDLNLDATAPGRSAGIGERLEAPPGQEVTVRLRVSGAAGCLARLCTDAGRVLEGRLGAGDQELVEWTTSAAASAWVRAEVRRPEVAAAGPGAMVALTNPVLLGAPDLSGRPPA
jgi:predicted metal-dependent phosphoesterase TrpH